MKDAPATLWAGSSGFSYDAWKGPFYPVDLPAKKRLAWYAEQLPTVEINNTFYRMPRAQMLAGWHEQVPETFRFVLKAPRRITHSERLKGSEESVAFLLSQLDALGDKLGALFFQLPPSLRADRERLLHFLGLLPDTLRVAFEFRHPSWDDPAIVDTLRDAGRAWVCSDTGEGSPPSLHECASFAMIRLRAPSYDDEALRMWLARLREQSLEDAFVFFKHEDEGIAPTLARRAIELWDEATP